MKTSEPSVHSPRSWLRVLGAPVLLASLAFSPLSSAQSVAVSHAYSGEDCETGAHNAGKNVIAIDGALTVKPGSGSPLSALCPIIRTKPTYRRVDVSVYLAAMDAPNEEDPNITVNCHMSTNDQNGHSALDDPNNQFSATRTITGIFHQSPLTVSYNAVSTASQPFWTDIISTVSKYRRTNVVCDGLPNRVAVRSYLVTEIP